MALLDPGVWRIRVHRAGDIAMSLLKPPRGRLAPELLPSLWCVAILLMSPIGAAAQATTSSKENWSAISAPAELGDVKAQWIKIDGRGEYKHIAAVFRPAGAGPFPVVVVLHGASGLQRSHIELAEQVS